MLKVCYKVEVKLLIEKKLLCVLIVIIVNSGTNKHDLFRKNYFLALLSSYELLNNIN